MLLIDLSGNARRMSFMSSPDTADLTPSGDFTIEVFAAKFAVVSGNQRFLSHYLATGNQRSWMLLHSGTHLQFVGSTNGSTTTIIQFAWVPTLGVEYDLACDRSGTTVRLYIDGAHVANGTLSGALHNSTTTLDVGSGPSGTEPFTGTAKAVRYTPGTARYATGTSYTVPSLPLPTSA